MKVSSDLDDVWKAIGAKDPYGEDDYASDYSHQAVSSFLEEWGRENEIEEAPEAVFEAVRDYVENEVQKSIYAHRNNELMSALEASMENAARVTEAEKAFRDVTLAKNVLTIEVQKGFLKIMRKEVDGKGYVAWGGDEKLSEIKDAVFVINVLDGITEVYGGKSIRDLAFDRNDRFEPDTGSYQQLARIADKVMKEHGNTYEVVVGNIGTVLRTTDLNAAKKTFGEYIGISKSGSGRGAQEEVHLLEDGEILREYTPLGHSED